MSAPRVEAATASFQQMVDEGCLLDVPERYHPLIQAMVERAFIGGSLYEQERIHDIAKQLKGDRA